MTRFFVLLYRLYTDEQSACGRFFLGGDAVSSNVRYTFAKQRVKQRKRLRGMYSSCPRCGVRLDWEHPYLPNSAEVDEIFPISKLPKELRGRAAVDPNNLQVLCRRCNKLKSNLTPQQEAQRMRAMSTPDSTQDIETSQEW